MTKGTLIAVGFCVLFAVVYALTREDKVQVGIRQLSLQNVEADQVDDITIAGGQGIHLLKDKAKGWLLELPGASHQLVQADDEAVKRFIDAAKGIKSSFFVTELREKFPEFGFIEGKLTYVTLRNKQKPIWDLEIGKPAQGGAALCNVCWRQRSF